MQTFTRVLIFIALILAGFIFLQRQVIYDGTQVMCDGMSYRGEGRAEEKDALLKKYLDPPKHSDIFYNIVFWNFENEHLDYQLYTRRIQVTSVAGGGGERLDVVSLY
ncbi:MAG: hypothetical protein ACK5T0_00785 [Vampirovibrionales bacterium]